VLFFEQLCNGCGGCTIACPENAISESESELGVVEAGRTGDLEFMRGLLNVGQPMATPVIAAVKERISRPLVILDVPPGTGCPVIECLRDSDFVLLVTEPTPFGLADLKAALDLCRAMKLRSGVIINRVGIGDDRVERFCGKQDVPVLLTIPESMDIARAYSDGVPFIREMPEWRDRLRDLYSEVEELVC
jgi:MinD superfamily P-loop ATPase